MLPAAPEEAFQPAGLPKSVEDLRDLDGLPPGSRMPFGRNAVFTGREEHLLKRAQALRNLAKGARSQ